MKEIEIKLDVILDYGYFRESKEVTVTQEEIENLAIQKLRSSISDENPKTQEASITSFNML